MKKVISLVTTIALLLTSISFTNVYAVENISSSFITEDEAKQLAILFVANNITNEQLNWDNDTKIKNVTKLYNVDDTISGYSIELCKNSESNGYVIISSNAYDNSIIQEFSSDESPLYHDLNTSNEKVYNVSPLEYFVERSKKVISTSGKIFDKNNFINLIKNRDNSNNILSSKNQNINNELNIIRNHPINLEIFKQKSDISACITGSQGDVITDPLTHLKDEYSNYGTWKSTSYGTLQPGIEALIQKHYETGGYNCSVTAITTVLLYYATHKGYTKMNSTDAGIYNIVRKIAEDDYKYDGANEDGLSPFDIDDVITDTFKYYGYNAKGNNDYIDLWLTIKSEISNHRSPVIMSMTGGIYDDHSVTVIGWTVFENRTIQEQVRFLKVYDNWQLRDGHDNSGRYINYEKVTIIKNLTKVKE